MEAFHVVLIRSKLKTNSNFFFVFLIKGASKKQQVKNKCTYVFIDGFIRLVCFLLVDFPIDCGFAYVTVIQMQYLFARPWINKYFALIMFLVHMYTYIFLNQYREHVYEFEWFYCFLIVVVFINYSLFRFLVSFCEIERIKNVSTLS